MKLKGNIHIQLWPFMGKIKTDVCLILEMYMLTDSKEIDSKK